MERHRCDLRGHVECASAVLQDDVAALQKSLFTIVPVQQQTEIQLVSRSLSWKSFSLLYIYILNRYRSWRLGAYLTYNETTGEQKKEIRRTCVRDYNVEEEEDQLFARDKSSTRMTELSE